MINAVLGLLLALTSPLLLLPVEKFLPYPYFIEEAVKLVIVVMMVKTERQTRESLWVWIFMAGFLFTVSESVFYLMNIFALGNFILFPQRLLLTGILHTSTIILMYTLGRKNYLGLSLGFTAAVTVHYFFNLGLAGL